MFHRMHHPDNKISHFLSILHQSVRRIMIVAVISRGQTYLWLSGNNQHNKTASKVSSERDIFHLHFDIEKSFRANMKQFCISQLYGVQPAQISSSRDPNAYTHIYTAYKRPSVRRTKCPHVIHHIQNRETILSTLNRIGIEMKRWNENEIKVMKKER